MSTFVGSQAEMRAQLDQPWDRARLVVLDFETNGLTSRVEIVSFGAVHIDSGRVVGSLSVYGLVRPQVPPSPESIGVHAIRPRDLETALPLPEALDPLLAAMVGRVLVAHTAWVETGFLDRALAARGIAVDLPVVDTAELAWAHFGVRRSVHKSPGLETVASRLGLPIFTPHHALGDAWTTALVFLAMAHHRTRGRPLPLRDLAGPGYRLGPATRRSWLPQRRPGTGRGPSAGG